MNNKFSGIISSLLSAEPADRETCPAAERIDLQSAPGQVAELDMFQAIKAPLSSAHRIGPIFAFEFEFLGNPPKILSNVDL